MMLAHECWRFPRRQTHYVRYVHGGFKAVIPVYHPITLPFSKKASMRSMKQLKVNRAKVNRAKKNNLVPFPGNLLKSH